MDVNNLSDDVLVETLNDALVSEAEAQVEHYLCLGEVEKRRVFLNYPSLWGYLTQEKGLDAATAMRKIRVSRMVSQFPLLKEKLAFGKLNPSLLEIAGGFFHSEKLDGEE